MLKHKSLNLLRSKFYNFNNYNRIHSINRKIQILSTIECLVKLSKSLKNIEETKYYSSRCLADLIKFTTEESNKILQVVNKKPLQELISYDISKSRVAKINTWRNKNGEFKNLEDILQIEGFGLKILEKFGKSILDENNIKKDLPRQKLSQFTIPIVSEKFKLSCNSCLSIHIGVSSITIARFELNQHGPCNLTDWKHFDLSDKKLHIHDLIQLLYNIDFEIPVADCYILENPQIAIPGAPGTPDQVNINIQKAQVRAILSYALIKRNFQQENNLLNDTQLNNNIFFLKQFIASKLFNVLVGTERVSTEQIVLDLLSTHYNVENSNQMDNTKFRGEISVPDHLRKYYINFGGYQKEFLGQSLLIGLTFIRLTILQCEKSFSKILGI